VFAPENGFHRFAGTDPAVPAGDTAAMSSAPFVPVFGNYYQTDTVSRASPTMAACIAAHAPAAAEAAE
jgi:NADH-quinone oxidoreductase subunit G